MSGAAAAGAIRFRIASATLAPESTATLDKLVAAVKACPTIKLRVEGHTDGDGLAETNQLLSEARAKSVYEYLSKAGVEPARMSSAGFGMSKPIADNDSAENKLKNRRIEFIVE